MNFTSLVCDVDGMVCECGHRHGGPCEAWGCRCSQPLPIGRARIVLESREEAREGTRRAEVILTPSSWHCWQCGASGAALDWGLRHAHKCLHGRPS